MNINVIMEDKKDSPYFTLLDSGVKKGLYIISEIIQCLMF